MTETRMVEFEGKICDVKDDKTVDPDITLSYIEDKVQNILGHHQKRFEGGVSAENLGARFGGYGSFLPMYRRLPSIFSQSASTKEPKPFLSYPHLAGEEAVVPVQRDCSSSAPSNHESHALKISPASASDRKNSIFCPDEGSASVQKVGFPSHKSINFSDLKKVRVRIKMGQNTLEKDNAEISRLGLAFSSSSRLNGHNEADGLATESPQILGDSLSGIFQMMTSSLVPGGRLLSPLCESLQNLCRGLEYSVKDGFKSEQKHFNLSLRPVKNDSHGQTIILNDAPSRSQNVAEAKKVKVKLRRISGENHSSMASTDVQDFKFLNDSESKGVKVANRDSKLTASLNAMSIDNGSVLNCMKRVKVSESSDGLPPRVGFLGGDECAMTEGKTTKEHLHGRLGKKGPINNRLDHTENPTFSMKEKPRKNAGIHPVKLESKLAEKLEKSNNGYVDRPASSLQAPVAGVTAGQPFGSLSGTEIASDLIQETWVACEVCDKWRLLPVGMKADQFPKKWICSMLNWLPGMNRCDISEDETTAAVYALFPAPVPETLQHLQGSANGNVDAGISGSGSQCNQRSIPNVHFAETKKPKMEGSFHPRKELLRSLAVEDRRPTSMNLFCATENVQNRPSINRSNESATVFAVTSALNPDDVVRDGTGPRKKARKKPVQQLDGFDDEEAKEVKNGIDMACKFLSNPDNQMKNLPGNESLTEKGFKNGKAAAKKIKLKHFGDTQHSASGQDNSRDLVVREAKLKKHRDDNDFQTFRGIHGDETERSNATEARVRSLKREAGSSYDASVKERKKLSLLRPREQLTAKDIDELKKDLGFEQISAAANSSSSTPFDCAKSKGSPQESVSSFPMRKFRPKQALPVALDKVESKFDDPPNISHVMRFSKAMPKERPSCPAVDSGVETLKERRDGNGSHCASKNEVTTDAVCTLPDTIRKSSRDGTTPVKRGSMKPDCIRKERNARREDCDQPVDRGSDPMKQSRQNCNLDLPLENRESASHLCSSGSIESLKCCSTTSGLLDACAPGDTPKLLTVGLPHETTSRPADIPVAPEPCLKNGNARGVSASFSLKKSEEVLREAEELRSHADLIKNSGFDSESHYEYFKAGLKFLHGASLLEDCSGDGRKRMEINLMQTYGIAAKLFKTCGYEYEKSREMAAAALAYKCMEVAYLKLVYYKSSNSSKLWHELQSILLVFPQDESPSSSASDVDNFNNLALGEKAASKATGGSHTIFARSQSNFVRLLDFTRDANYGMEAVKKAHETFASAVAETKKNGDALASVKSVIDLSFHNVEELVALVSLALNDINSQPID